MNTNNDMTIKTIKTIKTNKDMTIKTTQMAFVKTTPVASPVDTLFVLGLWTSKI